jgi:Xaa-Pro aminopeptidase
MSDIDSGLVLLLGNASSPKESRDNCYVFHQDSSFLYFFGIDLPGLAAVLDAEEGIVTLFGNELSLDDLIWAGAQPTLESRCKQIGVHRTAPFSRLQGYVEQGLSKGRTVHYLPPYRDEQTNLLADLLKVGKTAVLTGASMALIRTLINQRSVKSPEEILQIEQAIAINRDMQTTAMKMAVPGRYEREVVGAIEGIAYGRSGKQPPFTTIFTIHGQTLHSHCHENRMSAGDLVVCDCGARSPMGYASDTTRTIPVGGRFSNRQKEIYEIVLKMQEDALFAMKPGVPFRDVHKVAARRLANDFIALGLMRGEVEQVVESGAYALFFPHGLGHMLGLDVHDMESLGEDHVGYTDDIRRDEKFGINRLRLAKPLESGFVVTVEPGIYFIPALIDRWRAEKRFDHLIDYPKLKPYDAFGGIRIEDDVLVTSTEATVLAPSIPKSLSEVEMQTGTHADVKDRE